MIEVECHSNLDGVMKETWPKALPCKPSIGEIIESAQGTQLEISSLVYKKYKLKWGECGAAPWILQIEMIPPGGMSVEEFHKGR